ncbi:MAG: hypothetical protein Q8P84_06320 [Deltaproteobacteria bacterium]|nr:hypothetical protein [Deltaproteobacteria bacterium]
MNENTQTRNDVSYIWTRFNPKWALSGVLAGIGAGLIAIAVGAFLSMHYMFREAAYPFKLIGAVWFGPSALNAATFTPGGLAGLATHLSLSAFFGFVFSQFVPEWTKKRILIIMGGLGGLAVWLFWSTMFLPSFNETMADLLPKPVSILLHLTFGLSFGVLIVAFRKALVKK